MYYQYKQTESRDLVTIQYAIAKIRREKIIEMRKEMREAGEIGNVEGIFEGGQVDVKELTVKVPESPKIEEKKAEPKKGGV